MLIVNIWFSGVASQGKHGNMNLTTINKFTFSESKSTLAADNFVEFTHFVIEYAEKIDYEIMIT